MNRKKRIKNILSDYFSELKVDVFDNSKQHIGHHNFDGNQESHFQLLIKNKNKNKLNRLEIHRIINKLLKDEFDNGLHSLEINITN